MINHSQGNSVGRLGQSKNLNNWHAEIDFSSLVTIGKPADNGTMSTEKKQNSKLKHEDSLSATGEENDRGVDEYELEPPDAEVSAFQTRASQEMLSAAESRIDVDELFREEDRFDHEKMFVELVRDGGFRFQTKHLLIATAILAIYLAVGQVIGYPGATLMLFVTGICGILYYMNHRERLHQAQLAERKKAYKAQLQAKQKGTPIPTSPPPVPNETDTTWQKALEQESSFEFNFTPKQILIAFTVAFIVVILCTWIGGLLVAALILGMVAAIGIGVHVAGYEPPDQLVLIWWWSTSLYVVMSIFSMIWTAFTAS
jgi:hypothetical protein